MTFWSSTAEVCNRIFLWIPAMKNTLWRKSYYLNSVPLPSRAKPIPEIGLTTLISVHIVQYTWYIYKCTSACFSDWWIQSLTAIHGSGSVLRFILELRFQVTSCVSKYINKWHEEYKQVFHTDIFFSEH